MLRHARCGSARDDFADESSSVDGRGAYRCAGCGGGLKPRSELRFLSDAQGDAAGDLVISHLKRAG